MVNGSLYLWVNVAAFIVPFTFSWHPKIRFVDEWRRFWPACLLTLAFFIAWDVWFTAQGVWGFNESHLIGVSLLGLPIEEWLFFVTIPYACVFTFFVFRKHYVFQTQVVFQTHGTSRGSTWSRWVLAFIVVLSTALCITHYDHWYTASATGLAAFFGLMLWMKNPDWLPDFIRSFFVLLIPFVLTNGVLTGIDFWTADVIVRDPSVVLDQVVWYNNAQNMGIRFFTIPFEDFFYAFVLIGVNVFLFERKR